MTTLSRRAFLAGGSAGLLLLAGCGSGSVAPAQSAPAQSSPAQEAPASASAPAAASSSPRPSAAASGLLPIIAGYTTNGLVNTPLWMAKERGFFAQNGLDVTLKSLVANAELPALIANELQFDGAGAAPVISADLEGGSIVLIAAGSDYPLYSLFAQKKYQTMADLAGQTIGVTALGSVGEFVARLFLRQFGLEDKVKIAAAGGSSESILAAMTSGGLAGGVLVPPSTFVAADQGFVELVNGVKLGIPMNHSGIEVTRAYLKDHPDTVKSFLKSYAQAWAWGSDPANKDAIVQIMQKYGKADARVSELGYETVSPVWRRKKVPLVDPQSVTNVLAFLPNPKAKTAQASDFIDNSLLESVAPSQ